VVQQCGLAPEGTVRPLLAEASELTAMLTAGMKRRSKFLVLGFQSLFVFLPQLELLYFS
jgi:hypothetical protein